jgi:predicted nucleic acid-binding protein
MTSDPRYVFDVNVIVSAALLEHSVPAQAFFAALNGGQILLSASVAVELDSVLRRPKFDPYLSPEDRDAFFVAIAARCAASQRDRNDRRVS